jgi:hypothetical protein
MLMYLYLSSIDTIPKLEPWAKFYNVIYITLYRTPKCFWESKVGIEIPKLSFLDHLMLYADPYICILNLLKQESQAKRPQTEN